MKEEIVKKYLLFLTSLELGGAERQALNFARFLKQRGNMVIVTGLSSPGKVCDICQKDGIRYISKFKGNFVLKKFLEIANIFSFIFLKHSLWVDGISSSYLLAKYIKKNNIDICISYCSPANTILGNAKKFYKKCIYVWFQRDAGLCYEPWNYRDRALHLCDYVLANSNTGKEWIKKNHDVEATIINNGITMKEPKKSKEEWKRILDVNDSSCVCTMIANLSSTKDHMVLLKAWKHMSETKMLNNHILVFAGRFDDQYEKLHDYAKKNQIMEYVRFLGQVEDISGLLRVTTIGVFGAISEGSPNGIAECGFFSLPVIATDLPEIREVLCEDNYRFLFKAGDIYSIAKYVVELDSNEMLRHKIGQGNKEKATNLFSANVNFKHMIELLEK